ncbi:MAG: SpoIIE family protein phosphatase [Phycisphaerae bacterium]|nr:SpoIIE family protein phosphatase [Phycisphaerae bacterium]
MSDISKVKIESIIDSLSDGVYVCDPDRRITYWSKSAQRITGWREEDVVGRKCCDNVLCHIDKDGHRLCEQEYCPLHRAMITDKVSMDALLVYAQGSTGQRIPMLVTVAPIRNDSGEIVGGVETFRDASAVVHDMERAQAIQQVAMESQVPENIPLTFTTHYIPRDIVGGDYYAIRELDEGAYGLILADVMGHGLAAAFYTIHLSSLWDRYCSLLEHPEEFMNKMNRELARVVKTEVSFATAISGILEMDSHLFRFSSAGGPEPILMHADGTWHSVKSSGMPLALLEAIDYQEFSINVHEGDSLLLLSDGALEIKNAAGQLLGMEGLMHILKKQGYPETKIQMETLEEELLIYSNAIRLEDDLTLIEIRFDKY